MTSIKMLFLNNQLQIYNRQYGKFGSNKLLCNLEKLVGNKWNRRELEFVVKFDIFITVHVE